MTSYKSILLLAFLTATAFLPANGQPASTVGKCTDSVVVNFRQSKWNLDPTVGDNAGAMRRIEQRLTTVSNDSVYRLRRVNVYGAASPEGSVEFNKQLSQHRAEALFDWFDQVNQLPVPDKNFAFLGRDWNAVLQLAEQDGRLPYPDETIELLRTIVSEKQALNGAEPNRSLERLRQLRDGEPYRYLYRNIFPKVRASKVVVEYERVPAPAAAPAAAAAARRDTIYIERVVEVRDTVYIDNCKKVTRKNH